LLSSEANRIALAAQNFAKQEEERLKLQEALQCEQRRLENLRLSATSSKQHGDFVNETGSDSGEEVKFSRRGRSKLVKIEGDFLQVR
jgi:hypothetical protein